MGLEGSPLFITTDYIEAFAKAPAPKLVKLSPIPSPTMEDFPKLTNPAA
jgi:hypothetical protein